ncbi:MAG: hypothetical protein H7A21_14070 [Spirochaetales bacterium]|nr:hypothetical protein [Leptospiraceae bacterium]MCP5482559.1 hypothetical protein [Spirochaetales bacterium]MCP5485149.1 hypothetical protein [Spirochaetales bacterium]
MDQMQNVYQTPTGQIQQGSQGAIVRGAGWSKFIGILYIIGGALYSITIFYAPIGVPMVFAGLRIMKGGEQAEMYARSGDPNQAVQAMHEYVAGMRILGIMAVIGFAVGFVILAVVIALAATGNLDN